MPLTDLIAQWEADAERLLNTAKVYRSTCNAALKSSYVARAATLQACAAAVRESMADDAD